MSFSNLKLGSGTFAVHFKLASNTSVNSGSAIPYALVSGTSGHGLSVSSGVISLPAGEWVCNFTLECATPSSTYNAQIYIDNIANTVFPQIQAKSNENTNMDSTTIVLKGNCDIELRPDTTLTFASASDLLIFGVKS